ncbi:MAG: hypothetical protein M3498_13940, partial [Deinococcota bacterium]|nr:hypothetical protein [Deinococcota bacterium]
MANEHRHHEHDEGPTPEPVTPEPVTPEPVTPEPVTIVEDRLRDRLEHARPLETSPAQGPHADHDKHAGHSPEMFKDRFWLSLVLTLPILYFDAHFQEWFSYG